MLARATKLWMSVSWRRSTDCEKTTYLGVSVRELVGARWHRLHVVGRQDRGQSSHVGALLRSSESNTIPESLWEALSSVLSIGEVLKSTSVQAVLQILQEQSELDNAGIRLRKRAWSIVGLESGSHGGKAGVGRGHGERTSEGNGGETHFGVFVG